MVPSAQLLSPEAAKTVIDYKINQWVFPNKQQIAVLTKEIQQIRQHVAAINVVGTNLNDYSNKLTLGTET